MNELNIKTNNGFITIELVLAFAILMINITGIILLTTSFNGVGTGYVMNQGQLVAIKNEINQEFIYKAQEQLEKKKIDANINFLEIINSDKEFNKDSDPPSILPYLQKLIVSDLTPCKKKVTSEISWNTSSSNPQKIQYSTIFTDIAEALALGGDCGTDSPDNDDWKKPEELIYNGSILKTEGYGKSLDVQNHNLFLVTKAAGNNKDDFYIFNTTDIDNPTLHGHLDISDGLEDIDVAGDFAYIANDENKGTNQLAVINISNIDTPSSPIFTSLPGVTGTCPHTCPGGRTIYYYKNRVYMGTHRLVASGAAEFHIFDVSNPNTPIPLGSKGGTALGDPVDHNINDIIVRDQNVRGVIRTFAYLVTSDDLGELIILDVTDPTNIPDPSNSPNTGSILNLPGVNTAGEELDGISLYVIGNRAYIGRKRAKDPSNKDFFVVDISNPDDPQILGSINLGLNSSGSIIIGIRVTSNLALVATTDPNKPFVVLNISEPTSITRWDIVDCGINFSTYATGIDYENNLIYLPLHNASSNINIKIIKSTGGSC